MKKTVPRKYRLPAAAVATVTILAMFLAPFCGSMCAATNGCASAAAISESGAGECHHTAISGEREATPAALASMTACNRPELSATLSSDSSSGSQSARSDKSTPLDAIATQKKLAALLDLNRTRWRDATGAVGSKDILASTTILQI